jgi:hypothetical protein
MMITLSSSVEPHASTDETKERISGPVQQVVTVRSKMTNDETTLRYRLQSEFSLQHTREDHRTEDFCSDKAFCR